MIFLCDIDGTIAELTPEQKKFVKNKEVSSDGGMSWEKDYYPYISKQEPIEKNRMFVERIMQSTYWTVFFVTGRSIKYEDETSNWLTGNLYVSEINLLMRPEHDYSSAPVIKRKLLNKVKGVYGGHSYLVFEDNLECQKMYKEEGCFIIQP